jgi:FixJ family two-component response regulator
MHGTATSVHVAILDDDPAIRVALRRLLRSAGMVVEIYPDSSQFFASLALKKPDCLLLDFQMPGLNGLDILNHLGQRSIHIPTVIMTAHDATGTREACINGGAVTYLLKPLDPDNLIQIIWDLKGGAATAPETDSIV